MKRKPVMLGARPHTAGGMSNKSHRKELSFDAVKRQASDYLQRKGLSGPSAFVATVPPGAGRIHP